jgi:hypothetical protein
METQFHHKFYIVDLRCLWGIVSIGKTWEEERKNQRFLLRDLWRKWVPVFSEFHLEERFCASNSLIGL